ncbi:hypothetical protein NMY22_g5654 [Coprinellus aureogranulatus]|nr:hypothetical protein NMY22_g5654 [Coprinellus aureogranulatus]
MGSACHPTRSFSRRTTRSLGSTFMLHGREQGPICLVTQWNWSVDGTASGLSGYLRLGPSRFTNAAHRYATDLDPRCSLTPCRNPTRSFTAGTNQWKTLVMNPSYS